MAVALTPGRRQALAVLLVGARAGRDVRYSNATSDPDTAAGGGLSELTVYWQAADWLEAEGLIQLRHGGTTVLRLTRAGRELAENIAGGKP